MEVLSDIFNYFQAPKTKAFRENSTVHKVFRKEIGAQGINVSLSLFLSLSI
jgi:hypothetical protein